MVILHASTITKEKAADAIAIGAMPCQTKRTFFGMLGKASSMTEAHISHTAAIRNWTEKRLKYHPLYLAGMLQMDSRSSSPLPFG